MAAQPVAEEAPARHGRRVGGEARSRRLLRRAPGFPGDAGRSSRAPRLRRASARKQSAPMPSAALLGSAKAGPPLPLSSMSAGKQMQEGRRAAIAAAAAVISEGRGKAAASASGAAPDSPAPTSPPRLNMPWNDDITGRPRRLLDRRRHARSSPRPSRRSLAPKTKQRQRRAAARPARGSAAGTAAIQRERRRRA